jgi:regulator of sirC expression with transglutaminase-like and TPR domain
MREQMNAGLSAMNETRVRFAGLAAERDERINVAEAALLIAQEEYPQLDVQSYLARLDDLAAEARLDLRADMPPAEQVARLNHFLFVVHRFAGNNEHYYDPRNSFLNDVLDRRTGIPITLSLVYSEVAQRLELPIYGVSFPGHFLVRHVSEPPIIIDPFLGSVITTEECTHRLQGIYGAEARLDRRLMRPAQPREILVRLLSNLKQIYVERSDFIRALACVDRILLLVPDLPRELRDRGILYQRLECFAAALRDFERYLKLAPGDEAAPLIRETLPDLQRRAAQLQ